MPPKKRSAGPARRAKRLRPLPASDLQVAEPATMLQVQPPPAQPPQGSGMVKLNLQALTSTITAAVSAAVKDALAVQPLANVSDSHPTADRPADRQVAHVVDEEVTNLTELTGTQSTDPQLSPLGAGDQPRQLFTSIGMNLGARVSAKIKAKIWAHEYIDFGALLSVAPPREKYSLSMTSTAGASGQPQLTLEPSHTPKKVTNIQQWITAFNTFVTIYSEKASDDAPKLMKYCEVVRDLSQKSADWLFYDEQFRYLRQSSPESYPWDQIHWELWLRAMTNFRGKPQSSASADKVNPRVRFRPSNNNFPKGTCWTFHAGRQCRGCQYEHVCFKCHAKHPASQCQVSPTHQRSNVGKSGSPVITPSVGQPTSHARKSGPV